MGGAGGGGKVDSRQMKVEVQRKTTIQHTAAEPQPKVEGASVLDKMWWFCKNAISSEDRNAMEEFIAETQGRDCGSTEWLRPADISGDAEVDQLSGRDDGLSVGQTGATDGIWQACAAGERALEASVSSKGRGSEAADEVSGLGRREQGRGSARDRGTRKDRGRVGMCAELCRALSDVRRLSQP